MYYNMNTPCKTCSVSSEHVCDCCMCSMLYNAPPLHPKRGRIMNHPAAKLVDQISCPSLSPSSHSLLLSYSVSSIPATILSLLSIRNKQTSKTDNFTVLIKHRNSCAHIFMHIHTNIHLRPHSYAPARMYMCISMCM